MAKQAKTAISPTREENYPEWYQQVAKAADLAEISAVRGCMVIKPWGYAIWENMQKVLDKKFKDTGHVNAYFPLFVPLSYLEKEAEHVEGFAKECAVVTHHRLEPDPNGGLRPAGKLEEPLVVRPTSETIIGETYAKWVQSYRDLPILINQWANVVRWEMRTRLFLRTTEFLWQEGHTVHETADEAIEETLKMLDVYSDFAEDYMAMPVIKGEKTADERFPGAVDTYTIEAMMQDKKALQSGTSHFLGQNFSKAQEIKFSSKEGDIKYAWTTSWGVSTRMIGGLIMTHSDDNGLVLPPKLAPKHVVLIPIFKSDEEKTSVLEYTGRIAAELRAKTFDGAPIEVLVDDRDMRGGDRAWQQIKRGVPIRAEIGPRDMASDSIFMGRRDNDPKDKTGIKREDFVNSIEDTLNDIQKTLYERALKHRSENSVDLGSVDEFKEYFKGDGGGFATVYCHPSEHGAEEMLKKLKVTARCIPIATKADEGTCIFSGKAGAKRIVFARSY